MTFSTKITLIFLLISTSILAQSYKDRYRTLNIHHYKLSIDLNDSTNAIAAKIDVSLRFRKKIDSFYLDLASFDSISNTGMKVDSVYQNKIPVAFNHLNDQLSIYPKHNFPNLTYKYRIKYEGIPEDGLIIGKNLHGERTFFGDNWPNRAHNWFPCVDHPSDKASIEYIVKAPNHYKIIANGELIEELDLEENRKQTHWVTKVKLPTKVMVIGAGNFVIDSLGVSEKDSIPITSWVYEQSKEQGFYDFGNTKEILDFYTNLFGSYPYKKLANVQSSTKYGGMENASAIFYPEKSITGNRAFENKIAHEIVHQWFGNSVTELDWSHIWLSEGFATYFANIYVQKSKSDSLFQQKMIEDRNRVLKFHETTKTPIIDTKTTDLMQLLNPNSYQKGSWVLHMLRKELGDDIFYKGIKTYYKMHKNKSASTKSFKNVMSHVSGKNLDVFFKQWLYQAEHPVIKSQWIYYKNKVRLIIDQTQDYTFEFPLDIELIYEDGTSEIKTIQIDYKNSPHVIESKGDVKELKYDPNNWLLFEIAEE